MQRERQYILTFLDLRSIPGVPKQLKYMELSDGTKNFDDETKLGRGRFDMVYRANVLGGCTAGARRWH